MVSAASFRQEFQHRMDALALPVARELFTDPTQALSNTSHMAALVASLGADVSIAALVARTLGLEPLMVAHDFNAARYTVAVIASMALASGQVEGGVACHGQLFRFTFQNQLQFPGWYDLVQRHPALLAADVVSARSYGCRARLVA